MAKKLANSLRSCVAGEKPEFAVKIGHPIVSDRGAVLQPEPEICMSAALLSCP
jgi:hypothetical protein